MIRTITPGTCKFCSCTEANACKLPNGDPCSWLDPTQTICNAPACIKQNADLIRRVLTRRRRRRTPAEIEEIKRVERRARAARSRQAVKMRADRARRAPGGGGRQ